MAKNIMMMITALKKQKRNMMKTIRSGRLPFVTGLTDILLFIKTRLHITRVYVTGG